MFAQIPDPSPGPKYWFLKIILFENYWFSMLGRLLLNFVKLLKADFDRLEMNKAND